MAVICLNKSVLDFMDEVISPESFVLEFGAGGSTPWFAKRCGKLITVEASSVWAQKAREYLEGSECDWETVMESDLPLQGVSDVDLALIDGVWTGRDMCARMAWPLLRSGGWLVFDDAQRERHADTVAWLNTHGEPKILRWSPGDVESARPRIAMAWCKA